MKLMSSSMLLLYTTIILVITGCGNTQTARNLPTNVAVEQNSEPTVEGTSPQLYKNVKEVRSAARLIGLEASNKALADNVHVLESAVHDLEFMTVSLTGNVLDLETTIIEHETANMELQTNNVTLEATVNEVVDNNKALGKDLIALETTVVQLKDVQKGLVDDNAALHVKVTDMGIDNNQLLDLNVALEATLTEKVTRNRKLTNDNEALVAQVSNLTGIADIPKPGKMIASRTYAGSKECLPISKENAFCIEILAPDVDAGTLDKIQEGLYHATKLFPVSVEELTTEIGVQDYIGITLWNSESSDLPSLARDNCLFRYDIGGGRPDCEEILISMFDMRTGAKAGNANIFSSSGFTIMAPYGTWSRYANSDVESHRSDFRKVLGHEYFHSYQQAHRLRVPQETRPALWLTEGSAEYAGNMIAADAGWIDWGHALRWRMTAIQTALDAYPQLSIAMNENRQQRDDLDITFRHIATYEMGFWATAFAASISSNDAILKHFWDDLEGYGWKESFRRNVGHSVEDFYVLFQQFLGDRSDGESLDWLSRFNLETIGGEPDGRLAQ